MITGSASLLACDTPTRFNAEDLHQENGCTCLLRPTRQSKDPRVSGRGKEGPGPRRQGTVDRPVARVQPDRLHGPRRAQGTGLGRSRYRVSRRLPPAELHCESSFYRDPSYDAIKFNEMDGKINRTSGFYNYELINRRPM